MVRIRPVLAIIVPKIGDEWTGEVFNLDLFMEDGIRELCEAAIRKITDSEPEDGDAGTPDAMENARQLLTTTWHAIRVGKSHLIKGALKEE